eukprot:sb/3465585/
MGDFSTVKQYQTGSGTVVPLQSIVGDKHYVNPEMFTQMMLVEAHREKEKNKSSGWGMGIWGGKKGSEKLEKKDFDPNMDLWSLGALLVFIICHKTPFLAATDDQLQQLYLYKEPANISGRWKDGKPVYSSDFEEMSPVSLRASKDLKNSMLVIVRYLLNFAEGQELGKLKEMIQDLRDRGICYSVDLDLGYGQFDHAKPNKQNLAKSAILDNYRKAMNLPVPVVFVRNTTPPIEGDISRHVYKFVRCQRSMKTHAARVVVGDYCRSVGELCFRVKTANIDLQLLYNLALVSAGSVDSIPDLEESNIQDLDRILNEVEARREEVKVIYTEHYSMTTTPEVLEHLVKRLGKWEEELRTTVGMHRRLALNKDNTGAIQALCKYLKAMY